ncbi:DUF6270 domain-containing protein [Bacillus subtilis]|nr:DUF6270 domain-containing protein [Bacillus subtilis]
MKLAIFGSCVSRDTAEFLPNAQVVSYVARQSVTSLNTPHKAPSSEILAIESPFQKKNAISDFEGSGLKRVTEHARMLDLVLIDLVDERRGFWKFPDGTTVTNSLETEAYGYTDSAKKSGAELIEFGTEEHFRAWRRGFATLIQGIKESGLWSRTVLMDLQWAAALDGSNQPNRGLMATVGRRTRRLRRGLRHAARDIADGEDVPFALRKMLTLPPTEAEAFARRAELANFQYERYSGVARSMTKTVVSRQSSELRIDREHKWGPQPFHFRREDYKSVSAEIQQIYDELETQHHQRTKKRKGCKYE